MRLYISTFLALITSLVCLAHQADLSSSFLSTTSGGMNVLQITSSLGAFEGEIDFIYTKEAYKTPEEFKELVIKHFKENVLFIVNGQDTLHFGTPRVILGHETKLVVEVLDIPKDISTVYFKNTMFKDMHHNQMAVMLSTFGFPNKQLELNNENNHHILLSLEDDTWTTQEIKAAIPFYKNKTWLLAILVALAIATVVLAIKRRKTLQ